MRGPRPSRNRRPKRQPRARVARRLRASLRPRARTPARPRGKMPALSRRKSEGGCPFRKVDIRLPGKGNSNSNGARPVYQIISMPKWVRTSTLSIKNSLWGFAQAGLAVPKCEGGRTSSRGGKKIDKSADSYGYLAHKKPHPPRTLQQDYAYGPTAVLSGGAFSYE